MELVNEQVTKEANLKVDVVGGNIVLLAKLDTSGLDADLKATLDGDYFFDLLAEKIPGKVDDAVFALLKQALKVV